MMQGKYVILKGSLQPIIFPNSMAHSSMGSLETVRSAGFIQFDCTIDEKVMVTCYGRSDSIGVKSLGEEDAELIQRMFE